MQSFMNQLKPFLRLGQVSMSDIMNTAQDFEYAHGEQATLPGQVE